jgi:hypothetical protein
MKDLTPKQCGVIAAMVLTCEIPVYWTDTAIDCKGPIDRRSLLDELRYRGCALTITKRGYLITGKGIQ